MLQLFNGTDSAVLIAGQQLIIGTDKREYIFPGVFISIRQETFELPSINRICIFIPFKCQCEYWSGQVTQLN